MTWATKGEITHLRVFQLLDQKHLVFLSMSRGSFHSHCQCFFASGEGFWALFFKLWETYDYLEQESNMVTVAF